MDSPPPARPAAGTPPARPPAHPDVVVGVDAAGRTHHALAWAADEAERRGAGLHILYAFDLAVSLIANDLVSPTEAAAAAERVCAAAAARVQARRPGVPVTSEVHRARPAVPLVDASRRAGVVVVGVPGRGSAGGLGAIAREVVVHAHGPVVVVRALAGAAGGPVVVGVDRHTRGAALDFALADAARRVVPVLAVHAVRARTGHSAARDVEHVARTVRAHAARYPAVDVRLALVEADPVEALLAESERAGLLVVGSRGLRGLAARRGSVSQALLRRAGGAVAVVR